MITLSKSKYLVGLQCPKRLWLEANRRDLLSPPSPARERVFSQGHEVGRLARNRFPGGVLISEDPLRWKVALGETVEALARGERILYEPSFSMTAPSPGRTCCPGTMMAPSTSTR